MAKRNQKIGSHPGARARWHHIQIPPLKVISLVLCQGLKTQRTMTLIIKAIGNQTKESLMLLKVKTKTAIFSEDPVKNSSIVSKITQKKNY